jgi:hypothetical protein
VAGLRNGAPRPASGRLRSRLAGRPRCRGFAKSLPHCRHEPALPAASVSPTARRNVDLDMALAGALAIVTPACDAPPCRRPPTVQQVSAIPRCPQPATHQVSLRSCPSQRHDVPLSLHRFATILPTTNARSISHASAGRIPARAPTASSTARPPAVRWFTHLTKP